MINLFFIRHGESESNLADVSGGRTDVPLTDKGILQAEEAGKSIKESGIHFDLIISSPMQRAHDTAKGIASHLDYNVDEIEILQDLIERDFGELDNKNMVRDFDISYDDYFNDERIIDDILNVEKLEVLYKRAQKALEYLKTRPEKNILVTAHGAFGRSLMRVINKQPYFESIKSIENAKLIKLI